MPICADCGSPITRQADRRCRACHRASRRAEYARRKADRARDPEWRDLWTRIANEEEPHA